jgi:hypothetical protein
VYSNLSPVETGVGAGGTVMPNIEKIKKIFLQHFEHILVLCIVALIVLITYFIDFKLVFLNTFYLPIIVAGYFLGK